MIANLTTVTQHNHQQTQHQQQQFRAVKAKAVNNNLLTQLHIAAWSFSVLQPFLFLYFQLFYIVIARKYVHVVYIACSNTNVTCRTCWSRAVNRWEQYVIDNDTGCKQVMSDCNYILYLTVQTALYLYVIPRDAVPGCITIMYRHEIIYGPVPTW